MTYIFVFENVTWHFWIWSRTWNETKRNFMIHILYTRHSTVKERCYFHNYGKGVSQDFATNARTLLTVTEWWSNVHVIRWSRDLGFHTILLNGSRRDRQRKASVSRGFREQAGEGWQIRFRLIHTDCAHTQKNGKKRGKKKLIVLSNPYASSTRQHRPLSQRFSSSNWVSHSHQWLRRFLLCPKISPITE